MSEEKKRTIKIEYDLEDIVTGIQEAVKREFTQKVLDRIVSEAKAEFKDQIKAAMQTGIEEGATQFVQNLMVEIFNTETVTIGGGWNEEPKVYKLKDYAIEQVKERLANNNATSSGKRSYGSRTFSEWFVGECIGTEIERQITTGINSCKKDVDARVKELFDKKAREMLSDTVFQVLMCTDTYKKLKSGLVGIAEGSGE